MRTVLVITEEGLVKQITPRNNYNCADQEEDTGGGGDGKDLSAEV